MGHKYSYYIISRPLEEVWNQTVIFWQNNNGKIEQDHFSSNGLFRSMVVKHGISLISWGEIFRMTFGFNINDSMTYVSVEISLEFGYGMQWKKPQKLMKKWALGFGIPPMKLVRTIDKDFFNTLNDIQYINMMPSPSNISKKKCPECGYETNQFDNFCKECGNKFMD